MERQRWQRSDAAAEDGDGSSGESTSDIGGGGVATPSGGIASSCAMAVGLAAASANPSSSLPSVQSRLRSAKATLPSYWIEHRTPLTCCSFLLFFSSYFTSAKMPSKGQVVSEDGGADREQERGRTPQKETATSKSSAGMGAPTAGSSVSGMAPADARVVGIEEKKIGETEITKPPTSGARLLSMSGDSVSIQLDLKKPFRATMPINDPQGKPLLVLEAKPVSLSNEIQRLN